MQSETLARLRAKLAKPLGDKCARVTLGVADGALGGGLKRGALHEVFARRGHETAATGFAAALAWRAASAKTVLWIRQDYSALEFGEIAASGLLDLGIDPSRVLLLRVAKPEDALRAASDALSCAALGAVVVELAGTAKVLDLTASRRLTLACAENGVTALLLRFGAEPDASSAETRWVVKAQASPENEENWGQPVFEAELVRNRQGGTGRWVMEWSCDDGIFREAPGRAAETDRGAVVPAPCDRPAAAALAQNRRTAA